MDEEREERQVNPEELARRALAGLSGDDEGDATLLALLAVAGELSGIRQELMRQRRRAK